MSIRKSLIVVAFVVLATSFGIPSQVSASSPIPKSLSASVGFAPTLRAGADKTLHVPMPWRANMVGISFVAPSRTPAGVAISIRTHDGSGWSQWEEVDLSDIGADGAEARHASPRISTEAMWVGTADALDVRVALAEGARAIHDVRVHLINSKGDAKPESIPARALHALGGFLRAQGQTRPADAMATQPSIITRAKWGADPRFLNLPCPGLTDSVKMVFVHHTAGTNSYSKSTSAAIVRGIYRYHTSNLGYCDIAYNFLVDRYGQIFEGRNGGITNPVIGAHTLGFNRETVGVSLLGSFGTARPTSAMLYSLEKLVAWRMDVAHIPPIGKVTMTYRASEKWKYGTAVSLNRISGHRDGSYTSCPGTQVYTRLPAIRDAVNKIGRPKVYLPSQSTSLLRPDGDGVNDSVRIAAAFSQNVNWSLSFANKAGVVRQRFSGTGSSLSQTWAGTASSGGVVPTGRYQWRLYVTDSSGHVARGASGWILVVTSHPNGVVLSDSIGRYAIKDGARLSVGPEEYIANFASRPSVLTGPGERARYSNGGAIPLREGTILQGSGSDPDYYIWSEGKLRKFHNHSTFTGLGYSSGIPVSDSYLLSLDLLSGGPDINDTDAHPSGAVVKDSSGAFWVIDGSTPRPLSRLAVASYAYRSTEVVPATEKDLLGSPGPRLEVRDGTLIAPTDGGQPWIVLGGMKHRFYSAFVFSAMGFRKEMLLNASAADISAIPTGSLFGA